MERRRTSGGIVFGLVALLAGAASAQEGETRRFTWRPSLDISAVADDNPLHTPTSGDGDFGVWLRPRMELGYHGPSYELGADASVDFRRYTNTGELDQVLPRILAFGEAGVLPGLTVRVSDRYVPQPEQLGLPEDDGSNLIQTNRVDADIEYWRDLDEGREFTVGVRGSRFDTESFGSLVPQPDGSLVNDPDFRGNFWETGGFLEFQNAFGRKGELYMLGRARYREFDDTPESNHGEFSALLGLRARFIRNLSLDVAGGYGILDYVSDSTRPRFLARADLRYRTNHGWNFQLGFHNRFTADITGRDFLDTTGRLSVEKFFGRRTAGTVTAFVSHLDQEQRTPASNLFGGVEVRVRRQLSRKLQLAVGYRFWQNGGAFALDDFQQNRVLLTLSYRH